MNNNPPGHDSLTIRERLRGAYREIIFTADHDFGDDVALKQAHQALYARIRRVEEIYFNARPRYANEVIPESNLTKYGNFLYHEGRERSYALENKGTSLHYPCLYKGTDSMTEPWMLPEVEEMFIHTAFACSPNFRLYEAELEKLDKIDLLERTMPGLKPECCTGDFHKVNPVLDHLFERAPGSLQPYPVVEPLEPHTRCYFNVDDYEAVLLKKRILSDMVKNLWSDVGKMENSIDLLNVHKSSLSNMFVRDERLEVSKRLRSSDGETSLQKLVNSITNLNEMVPKIELPPKEVETPENVAPARRLYSDVVQGNKSPPKIVPDGNTSKENVVDSIPPLSLDSSPTTSLSHCNRNENTNERNDNECNPDVSPTSKCSQKSGRYTYSDAVNNSPDATSNYAFMNDFSNYDNNFRNYQGYRNTMQYMPNTVYNTNFRMGLPTSSYSTGTFGNQGLMNNRPNATTACQQQPWFITSCRPPNLCNYGNFLGQLLLPQMPSKHRWANTLYGRPSTPQNVYQQQAQNFGVQNMYQTNSIQQMSTYTMYENQKSKMKKPAHQQPNPKFAKPKSVDLQAGNKSNNKCPFDKKNYPSKILTKPASDYKLMTRQECDGRTVSSSSSRSFETATAASGTIPVGCSASDELEKIALREYQSSDMFFTEIERQAKEQYDGNPENSCCPPTERSRLGGLKTVRDPDSDVLHLYLFFNTCYAF